MSYQDKHIEQAQRDHFIDNKNCWKFKPGVAERTYRAITITAQSTFCYINCIVTECDRIIRNTKLKLHILI